MDRGKQWEILKAKTAELQGQLEKPETKGWNEQEKTTE
jgi:hypothetical protein